MSIWYKAELSDGLLRHLLLYCNIGLRICNRTRSDFAHRLHFGCMAADFCNDACIFCTGGMGERRRQAMVPDPFLKYYGLLKKNPQTAPFIL